MLSKNSSLYVNGTRPKPVQPSRFFLCHFKPLFYLRCIFYHKQTDRLNTGLKIANYSKIQIYLIPDICQ